jgi:hypothetical protein|tara:strand:- start:134 stop:634 length:501 start_codon:yes stop_codon:yes gene_type:complete
MALSKIPNAGFSGTKGITMVDLWRVSSTLTGDQSPITNLERADDASSGTIGSAMSVSSGIFTFPETGIYLVEFQFYVNLNGTANYAAFSIKVTQNNNTYDEVAKADESTDSSSRNSVGSCKAVIDVTDTSNDKVKFTFSTNNQSLSIVGSSSVNHTTMMFTRLGDT